MKTTQKAGSDRGDARTVERPVPAAEDFAKAEGGAPQEGLRGSSRFALYHPTASGGGCALRLDPRVDGDRNGRARCFFLEMAAQKTVASELDGRRVPATFDWEHKLTVKLDMPDLCELLAVLEGHAEKAGGTRNGLYHDNGRGSTVISLQRNSERGGFGFGLSRKENGASQVVRHHMVLSAAEALGLAVIFRAGIERLVFASPQRAFGSADAAAESVREVY